MSLKEIFCQDKAINILQRSLAADKMPHAYIFAGPEGVGKFKTACEWAKLLLCESPIIKNNFADSCGSCRSCSAFGGFEADSHPDFNHIYKELREFTKDGRGKPPPVDMPIDVVREFLIEKIFTKPTLSKRKVFVVDEAERLNPSSQNALLKVLEEPPEYCCIILLCTRLEKLLPTTKSRCRIMRFAPIDERKIIELLEHTNIERKKAQYFARLAQGSIGMAHQWAQLELEEVELYETKKQLVDFLAVGRYSEAIDKAEWLLGKSGKIAAAWVKLRRNTSRTDINRRAAKTLVQIAISALYDAMKLNLAGPAEIINFDQKEQIEKLAQRFDSEQSAEKIEDCYETIRWIDASVNEKLIFERLLLNLVVSDKMNRFSK